MDAVMVAQILAGILGTIIVGAIGYAVGMRGKMTTSDCQKCQTACSERMQIKLDAMAAKYAELSLHQDRIDAWVGSFNDYDREMKGHVVSKDRIGHNIDWIFATNSLRIPRWRTVAHFDDGRIRGTIASDHYLVTAHIVLP